MARALGSSFLLGLLLLPRGAAPQGFQAGSMIRVEVDVDGRAAPLYCAPRSDRFYLEAHEGSNYAIHLTNQTGERLGVSLDVDGLNVISGERASGRMYILDPWGSVTVRGWRTSLEEVRRFTFVDERVSYAVRSGQTNNKMGWIEVSVYRERRVALRRHDGGTERERPGEPASSPSAGASRSEAQPEDRAGKDLSGRGFPGTGWGDRAHDPVVLVHFDPEREPAERITLRYEYAPALQALGILPPRHRDRLSEREHATGFAKPPLW